MPHYKFDQIAFNITDKKMPEPGDEKMYIGLEHLDSGSLKVNRWGSEVELTGQKLVMKKGDILFGRRKESIGGLQGSGECKEMRR